MWFKYSKRVPSARFLTFLYEVVCLYDGVPENRGDYLLVPFAFDEDLLEKDESYDEEWRQLRLQQVGLVIDGAIDIIRICLSKHTEVRSHASPYLFPYHSHMFWAFCRESALPTPGSRPAAMPGLVCSALLFGEQSDLSERHSRVAGVGWKTGMSWSSESGVIPFFSRSLSARAVCKNNEVS